MRAPLFWNRPRGLVAALLWPVSLLWQQATRRRLAKGPWEAMPVPVICVGNLTAGGVGKTPTVIALLEILSERGVNAHVVSRGYGGTLPGPVQVDERQHRADEVGDEPLLIAAFGPCWVASDRAAGARAAIAAGAEAVVLDDGFQNPALRKDFSIVVIDAETGFGNGCVLPAGPLRESVAEGLVRAQAVLLVGPASARENLCRRHPELRDRRCFGGEIRPLQTGMDWSGTRFLAFAGIGRPGKFFATLEGLGGTVVARHAFGDHEVYSRAILQRLEAEAKALGAQLVTTEKDAARLPPEFRRKVLALPVRMQFEDRAGLAALLGALF